MKNISLALISGILALSFVTIVEAKAYKIPAKHPKHANTCMINIMCMKGKHAVRVGKKPQCV